MDYRAAVDATPTTRNSAELRGDRGNSRKFLGERVANCVVEDQSRLDSRENGETNRLRNFCETMRMRKKLYTSRRKKMMYGRYMYSTERSFHHAMPERLTCILKEKCSSVSDGIVS